MNNNFEQFIKKAKEVHLPEKEKAQGRELLSRYMQMNPPVRFSEQGRHQLQRSWFSQLITRNNILYKPMVIVAVLLIAVAAGGGVSLAAENALPGEVLYPVKVEVNENVRTAFAFSQEAKAEWRVEQTERRLQEAEKLAVQGELEGSAAATVESKFEQHTQSLAEIASELEARGNVEAAAQAHSNLEAALDAHARILATIQASGRNGAVTSILAKVRSRTEAATQARTRTEAEVSGRAGADVQVAAQGSLQAAQNVIAETKTFIERNKARAGGEASGEAEANIIAAEQAVAQGEARMQAEAYGEAFVLFQQAIRIAQEAKAFMQGGIDIDLNIGLDVQGETQAEQETREEGTSGTGTESNAEVESETEVEGGTGNGGIRIEGETNLQGGAGN